MQPCRKTRGGQKLINAIKTPRIFQNCFLAFVRKFLLFGHTHLRSIRVNCSGEKKFQQGCLTPPSTTKRLFNQSKAWWQPAACMGSNEPSIFSFEVSCVLHFLRVKKLFLCKKGWPHKITSFKFKTKSNSDSHCKVSAWPCREGTNWVSNEKVLDPRPRGLIKAFSIC